MSTGIENIPPQALANVVNLARRQLDLEQKIQQAELELESLKENHRTISEGELPDAMAMIEMKELVLSDGSKLRIEPFYGASITAAHQEEAFAWLKANGHDSLIKHDMVVSFGKGEEQKAEEAARILTYAGYKFSDKRNVHSQTLKAFVREQVEDGAPLPQDLFSVHIGKKTIIKKG